jgi:hypothetical protein
MEYVRYSKTSEIYKIQNYYVNCPCALSEHHAMKVYWGSGDIAPHILDLCTRWR